jgi:predicted ester cyclase
MISPCAGFDLVNLKIQMKKISTVEDIGPEHVARPLIRGHMPEDYRISLDSYVGRAGFGSGFAEGEQRLPVDAGLGQPMRQFEERYRNIIDYIVRITYRIWEDRDVEYIADTYSEDSRVYDDYGLQLGNQKIISDTHHTTGAFSNIQLIADEIVWAGDDEIGFHTSHRTLIRGTNDGYSKYGPATGRNVDVLVIANCVALGNKIFLEHVLYNNSALILQLGLDLEEMADRMAADPPVGWPRHPDTWQALRSAASPIQALSVSDPVSVFDVDAFSRDNFQRLWNEHDDSVLLDCYVPDFRFQGPGNRGFTGTTPYRTLLAGLRRAFPDLELQLDEIYWMGNELSGFLSSVRWSATGTHRGDGLYGPASGCVVQIWGITQQKIVNGRIAAEWMLYNELDLMMQIAASRSK